MRVLSLGWEDSLEKEMKTHSSISCLESSMDRGAWWAIPDEVAKSQTEHVCTHNLLTLPFFKIPRILCL